MSWVAQTKMVLASLVFRHRLLNRWAHKQLPKKRLAAGVLLFDDADRLLIVKPSYRPDWLVPGGIVENNESPWVAARREMQEEIGLEIELLRLIVIDWRSSDDRYDDSLHFIFDGGKLTASQQASIHCDAIEIIDHRFVNKDEAETFLDPHLTRRIMPYWRDGLKHPHLMTCGEPEQQTL